MIVRLGAYFRSRRAVSALEYAVIVGVIVVGMGTALVAFRTQINNYLTNTAKGIATMT